MRITVLLHDDVEGEAAAVLQRFVEDMARIGCALTVKGDPPEQAPEAWKITPTGLGPSDVNPPAISYDLGGSIAMRLLDAGASSARRSPFVDSNAPEKLEVSGKASLPPKKDR